VTDPVTVLHKKLIFPKNVKTLDKVNVSGHPVYQMTNDRGQRTEDRGQKTEDFDLGFGMADFGLV